MNYTLDLFNTNIKGQRSKNIADRQTTQKYNLEPHKN